ncbi:MAG: hypothetical protein ACFFDT_16655, partial [Candidatus Hodarchaeota archaeon]
YRTKGSHYDSRRESELIAIHFTEIPELVSTRKCFLSRGWGIATFKTFRGSIKKKFEKLLSEEVEKAIEGLDKDEEMNGEVREQMDKAVGQIEDFLRSHIKIRSVYRFVDLQLTGVDQIKERFPPCMKGLWLVMENEGHLTHTHRLQLGFFLKEIGMTLEEQLHFWYEKSVDNVGMSFQEFNRRIGYQIRHMYGLEGSRTDYKVMKCETNISSYFCPFFHLSHKKIIELVSTYLGGTPAATFEKEIMNNLMARRPTRACGRLLKEINPQRYHFEMKHPMSWLRALYGKSRTTEDDGDEEDESGESSN